MSILALLAARHLADSVKELLKSSPLSVPEWNFDVVLFEAAVFVHVMSIPDNAPEDESDDPWSYAGCMESAVFLTAGILSTHTNFDLHEDYFERRVLLYDGRHAPVRERLAGLGEGIAASLKAGRPTRPPSRISLDLWLVNIHAATHVWISMLDGTLEAIRRLHEGQYDLREELGL